MFEQNSLKGCQSRPTVVAVQITKQDRTHRVRHKCTQRFPNKVTSTGHLGQPDLGTGLGKEIYFKGADLSRNMLKPMTNVMRSFAHKIKLIKRSECAWRNSWASVNARPRCGVPDRALGSGGEETSNIFKHSIRLLVLLLLHNVLTYGIEQIPVIFNMTIMMVIGAALIFIVVIIVMIHHLLPMIIIINITSTIIVINIIVLQ